MKLLSFEKCSDNKFIGYIEGGQHYKAFVLTCENALSYDQTFPKNNYKNYEHFAGVMGKFDPYAVFLREPIEIERPSFDKLLNLWKREIDYSKYDGM